MSRLSEYREALFDQAPTHEHVGGKTIPIGNNIVPAHAASAVNSGSGGSAATSGATVPAPSGTGNPVNDPRVAAPSEVVVEAPEVPPPPEGVTQIPGDPYSGYGPSPLDSNEIVNWTYFPATAQYPIARWSAGTIPQGPKPPVDGGPGGDTTLAAISAALGTGEIQAAWPTGLGRWTVLDGNGRYIDLEPNASGGLNWFAPKTTGTVPPDAFKAPFLDASGNITPQPPASVVDRSPFVGGPVQGGLGGEGSFTSFDPFTGSGASATELLSANLQFGAGQEPLPVTRADVLTNMLREVNPGAIGNPSVGFSDRDRTAGFVGSNFGVDTTGMTDQELFALTALQGQQPQNAPSRDQSVLSAFGVPDQGDPIANAAIAQQLHAAQVAHQAMGLDPIAAAARAIQDAGMAVPTRLQSGLPQPGQVIPQFDNGTPPGGFTVNRPSLLIDQQTRRPVAQFAGNGRPETVTVTPQGGSGIVPGEPSNPGQVFPRPQALQIADSRRADSRTPQEIAQGRSIGSRFNEGFNRRPGTSFLGAGPATFREPTPPLTEGQILTDRLTALQEADAAARLNEAEQLARSFNPGLNYRFSRAGLPNTLSRLGSQFGADAALRNIAMQRLALQIQALTQPRPQPSIGRSDVSSGRPFATQIRPPTVPIGDRQSILV